MNIVVKAETAGVRHVPRSRSNSSIGIIARTKGWLLALGVAVLANTGCTSFSEYVGNGFKVGPNYQKPPAPEASEWIDSKSKEVNRTTADLAGWWTVFQDPKLNTDWLLQYFHSPGSASVWVGPRTSACHTWGPRHARDQNRLAISQSQATGLYDDLLKSVPSRPTLYFFLPMSLRPASCSPADALIGVALCSVNQRTTT